MKFKALLALNNSFNEIGLDHVILVKVASTAVVTLCGVEIAHANYGCFDPGMGGWS